MQSFYWLIFALGFCSESPHIDRLCEDFVIWGNFNFPVTGRQQAKMIKQWQYVWRKGADRRQQLQSSDRLFQKLFGPWYLIEWSDETFG